MMLFRWLGWDQGDCSEEELSELKEMCVKSWDRFDDGILPTKLHTHRNNCDQANAMVLVVSVSCKRVDGTNVC